MTHPIRILPRAREDFLRIFSYIEKHSPDGARRWRDAFTHGIERVSDNPEHFGLAPENELTTFELRQILFKTPGGLTYRAVLTLHDGDVLILRLRGPGQLPLRDDELSLA